MPMSPLIRPAEQTIEEVFLTPRVLDRRAFDEYAASLSRLIQDATGEHQTLARTAADVRVLRDQLAQAAADAQKRLDAALKLIATLDQRIVEPRPLAPAATTAPAQPAATPTPSKGRTPRGATPTENAAPEPTALAAATQAIEARLSTLVDARVAAALDARPQKPPAEPPTGDRTHEGIAQLVAQALDERLSGLDQHFEQALERRLTALTDRVESIRRESWSLVEESRDLSARAIDRAHAAEQAIAALAARVEALPTTTAPQQPDTGGIDSLDRSLAARLDERARAFEQTIEAAARRFAAQTNEQGARLTEQAREAIEKARAECEAAVRQISTGAALRVRKAQSDVEGLLASLEAQLPARLDGARSEFARTFEALSKEAQERATWLKAALAQAESADLSALREAVEQARSLADPAREGSLAGVVARATELRAGVETNLVQLSDLSKQVGLMRDLLARSIMDGVSQIDTLDARVEELLLSTARAIERYSEEVDAMRSSIEASIAAQTSIAPPAPDGTGVTSGGPEPDWLTHVESRIAELKTQVDEAAQASEWLAGLVDRAAGAGISLDEALTDRRGAPHDADGGPTRRARADRSPTRVGDADANAEGATGVVPPP